jgi:hypothetical protein
MFDSGADPNIAAKEIPRKPPHHDGAKVSNPFKADFVNRWKPEACRRSV